MRRNDFLRWFFSGFCVLELPHQLTPAKDTNSNPSTKRLKFLIYFLSPLKKDIKPAARLLLTGFSYKKSMKTTPKSTQSIVSFYGLS